VALPRVWRTSRTSGSGENHLPVLQGTSEGKERANCLQPLSGRPKRIGADGPSGRDIRARDEGPCLRPWLRRSALRLRQMPAPPTIKLCGICPR
jgi:hypothetical protein